VKLRNNIAGWQAANIEVQGATANLARLVRLLGEVSLEVGRVEILAFCERGRTTDGELRRKGSVMCAKSVRSEVSVEEFAGAVADLAYPVALKHGVKGSSVDIELDVWQALRAAIGGKQLSGRPAANEASAELTQAAYQVALRRGFSGSFVDVELDLWKALSLVS